MLGRKQSSDHADWLRAWDSIRAEPDRGRADLLVAEAADRVRRRLESSDRATFGWSGGKDSLALEAVCREAGLDDCVLVISGLEWPAFLRWATSNMPWHLAVECRSHLDLDWLCSHPEMLFPQDAATAARWFSQVQHAGQRAYCRRTGTDLLLLGRRRADGNFLGDETTLGYEYRDREGFARYSPIADWSHEDVLHVLATHDVELPPCYGWPRGFRVGTGPWPQRQWTGSVENGWAEVAEIDRSVLENAARVGLPGAAEALETATCAA